MKVLLAFFIVFIHTGIFYDFDETLSHILVNGVFRIAVPLFFIINGYYFTIYNIGQLKIWFKKIFILYIVWTIIYLPAMIYFLDFKRIIFYSLIGYFILWYLIALMFSGLLLYYIKNWKSSYILLSSFSLLLIGYIIQTLGRIDFFSGFLGSVFNFGPFHRNFIFFGFSFLAIGYLIKRDNFYIDKNLNIILIFLFSIFFLIEVFINYYISEKALDILISLFIICPLIFIYVKNIEVIGSNKDIANFSTAIFLIHAYVLFFTRHFFTTDETLLSLITVLVSCIVSFFLVKINSKFGFLL